MKKVCVVLLLMFVLTGCSAKPAYETLGNVWDSQVSAPQHSLQLELPEEAALMAMDTDENEKIYLCNGYTLTLQTVPSGDINRTLQQTTGFTKDQLTVMKTQQENAVRYMCAWSSAGEGGQQVGRAAILDDGSYHYVVSVMADAEDAGILTSDWQDLLNSVSLHTD